MGRMYLVTGGKGYVGRNLLEKLDRKEGYVYSYDRRDGNDIRDCNKLEKWMCDMDVCIHLAAVPGKNQCEKDMRLAVETNIIGTNNILCTAEEYNVKTVFVSTMGVLSLANVYDVMKYAGESVARNFGAVIVRPGNIYGGLDFLTMKDSVICKFIKNYTMSIHGEGKQKRDFIHIDDVVNGLIKAVDMEAGTYHLNTGVLTSVRELAETVADIRKWGRMEFHRGVGQLQSSPQVEPNFDVTVDLREGLRRLIVEGK